jgi:hypothetical protein
MSTALRTRKPTGLAPWPFLVIEGAEKSGKSFSTVLMTADQRLGRTFWFDLGEGAADQYGTLPGARYDVVDFDGSYRQLLAAVTELVATVPGIDAQGRPNVVVLDSGTQLWTMLKNEATAAARGSQAGRRALERDANAEVPVTMDKWNRAAARWKAIVEPLVQWPGLVIMTARGKEVVTLDDGGRPIPNAPKTYTIEAHKTMVFDADVIVRAVRPGVTRITGARSAHDLRTKLDTDSEMSLAAVLFDVLKLGGQMGTRDLKVAPVETDADDLAGAVATALAAIAGAPTDADLRGVWNTAKGSLPEGTDSRQTVLAAVNARLEVLRTPAAVTVTANTDSPLDNYNPTTATAAVAA